MCSQSKDARITDIAGYERKALANNMFTLVMNRGMFVVCIFCILRLNRHMLLQVPRTKKTTKKNRIKCKGQQQDKGGAYKFVTNKKYVTIKHVFRI